MWAGNFARRPSFQAGLAICSVTATSSASMLIAATEWWRKQNQAIPGPVVLAAFGAGLHWGSLLALP